MSHAKTIETHVRATALALFAFAAGYAAVQQALAQPIDAPADAALETRAKVLFDRALQLQQTQEYEEAAESYLQVLEIKPQSASTLNNLGGLYAALGDTEQALQYYERAAAVADGNQAFYRKQYADMLWQAKREREAVVEYRAVISQQPQATAAHDTVANFYLQGDQRDLGELIDYLWELVDTGEILSAAETALTALESGKSEERSADLLTVVARALGHETLSREQSEAIRLRLRALARDPMVGAGVAALMAIHESPNGDFSWWAERGNPQEDPARGMWPRDAFLQLARALGTQAERDEDFDLAEAYYFTAARLDPDEPDPLAFLALCQLYLRQDNFEKLESIVDDSTIVTRMFEGKGEAYRRGQLDKIYRYHVTLGYIYGSLATKDIVAWGNSNIATSAVFQLEHARTVGALIDEQQGNQGPPHIDVGVVELLATYYGQESPARATELRIDSARRLMNGGSEAAARQVLSTVPRRTLQRQDAALFRQMEAGN
jgi:tetratricopeptide (TPR) repeat protein